MRKTQVEPWSDEWTLLFAKEAKDIRNILQENLLEIYHIGSTSIPTIGYAKPIIDILVVVKNIQEVDQCNVQMRALGYEAKGENGIPGRRFFMKGGENRTHHVHIFQGGDKQIHFHLDFKEYLLSHPDQAKIYKEKKLQLISQFPDNHEQYQEGKQELVTKLARLASQWGEERRKQN